MTNLGQPLYELWRKIDLRIATEQEKIDVAALSGKSKDLRLVPRLLNLLDDEEGTLSRA